MRFPLVVFSLGLGYFSFCISAPSSTIRTNHVIHEKRAVEPQALDWTISHRPEGHKRLPLRIGLTQQNVQNLEDMLMAISHPDSSEYGKHWTPQQVVDTFAPAEETVRKVVGWLKESGFSTEKIKMSANKGWLQIDASVAEVEELLNTEYHVYKHLETGEEQIGE